MSGKHGDQKSICGQRQAKVFLIDLPQKNWQIANLSRNQLKIMAGLLT